mgnify:FL=1
MFKSGFVAIVGRANVGKSTLLNSLLGQKLSIVTDKAQTTRQKILGVLNGDDYQIVFADTPGMHKPKTKLDDYMVDVIKDTMSEMDLILMMVDGAAGFGPGDAFMINALPSGIPKILLINKIDKTNVDVETITKEATALSDFEDVLAISAVNGLTTQGIVDKILEYLPEGPAYFGEDQWTNINERDLVSEMIREKALQFLDKEVPHGIAVVIDSFDDTDMLRIEGTIIVEKESHKGIVIGKGGRKLKGIGQEVRRELELMYDKKVFLELWVKVKPNWRNKAGSLQDFGYKR